jgi:hypothetical protein
MMLSSAAQNAHAHVLLCRAQRCGTGAQCTQTHVPRDAVRVRLPAHSADGLGLVLQAAQERRLERPAKAEVRRLAVQPNAFATRVVRCLLQCWMVSVTWMVSVACCTLPPGAHALQTGKHYSL